MNLHLLGASALLATTLSAPALAESWTCSFTQDCEMGEACRDLPEQRKGWLTSNEDGSFEFKMDISTMPVSEIAGLDTGRSFIGVPSPNNVVLLTLHKIETAALTVHYTSPDAFYSNTMRGTCKMEAD